MKRAILVVAIVVGLLLVGSSAAFAADLEMESKPTITLSGASGLPTLASMEGGSVDYLPTAPRIKIAGDKTYYYSQTKTFNGSQYGLNWWSNLGVMNAAITNQVGAPSTIGATVVYVMKMSETWYAGGYDSDLCTSYQNGHIPGGSVTNWNNLSSSIYLDTTPNDYRWSQVNAGNEPANQGAYTTPTTTKGQWGFTLTILAIKKTGASSYAYTVHNYGFSVGFSHSGSDYKRYDYTTNGAVTTQMYQQTSGGIGKYPYAPANTSVMHDVYFYAASSTNPAIYDAVTATDALTKAKLDAVGVTKAIVLNGTGTGLADTLNDTLPISQPSILDGSMDTSGTPTGFDAFSPSAWWNWLWGRATSVVQTVNDWFWFLDLFDLDEGGAWK